MRHLILSILLLSVSLLLGAQTPADSLSADSVHAPQPAVKDTLIADSLSADTIVSDTVTAESKYSKWVPDALELEKLQKTLANFYISPNRYYGAFSWMNWGERGPDMTHTIRIISMNNMRVVDEVKVKYYADMSFSRNSRLELPAQQVSGQPYVRRCALGILYLQIRHVRSCTDRPRIWRY